MSALCSLSSFILHGFQVLSLFGQQEASASFCQVEFVFHGYQFECPTSFTTGPFAVLCGATATLEGGAAHHSRLDASAASGQQGGGFVI